MGEPERAGSDDVQLQKAVQVLVSNCGEDVLSLIESGHQHLDRETILRLSRRTPERQRYELGQLRQGRRPFSTKSVVFDTISFGKVPSRLARASGKVNKAHVMIARWVTSGKQVTINQTAALVNAIRPYIRDCGDLWKLIRNGSWDANNAKGRRGKARPPKDESDWSHLAIAQCSPQKALACLAYRTFVAKCLRDLPRAQHLARTRQQVHWCGVRLSAMISHLKAMEEAITSQSAAMPAPKRRKRVATHAHPDVDALTAVWLVERFLFAEKVDVLFLPYQHDWAKGPRIDCVVDMGGLHDPRWGLFDHKEPSRDDRHATCATRLVWEHLAGCGQPVLHLGDLVQAVHAGDSIRLRGSSEAFLQSKSNGLHACFDRLCAAGKKDHDLYVGVSQWLDRYHAGIR